MGSNVAHRDEALEALSLFHADDNDAVVSA